jgi:hypothetical protein
MGYTGIGLRCSNRTDILYFSMCFLNPSLPTTPSFKPLPSVVLVSIAAIQLSRSALEAAWNVCLCPLILNEKSLELSLVTSEASACKSRSVNASGAIVE